LHREKYAASIAMSLGVVRFDRHGLIATGERLLDSAQLAIAASHWPNSWSAAPRLLWATALPGAISSAWPIKSTAFRGFPVTAAITPKRCKASKCRGCACRISS
jgi:hypothetical protein